MTKFSFVFTKTQDIDHGSTNISEPNNPVIIDAKCVTQQYSSLLHGCIVSSEDIYTAQYLSEQIVGRIAELSPVINNANESEDENEKVEDYEIVDTYRGIVGLETEFFITLENSSINWDLKNSPKMSIIPPHKDLINVYTKDNEHFPVLRRLLRPCITLTSVVQKGRGIYDQKNSKNNHKNVNDSVGKLSKYTNVSNGSNETESEIANENEKDVTVDVEACTFDKVLLYLEHEVRSACV
jgi:hypothetical protein